MAESEWHKRLKNKDAGLTGDTEVSLPSGGRIDALTGSKIGVEIERGGNAGIQKSISNLIEALDTGVARKARLRVHQQDMEIAEREMKRQGLKGELTNLTGTVKKQVGKRK